MVTAINFFLGVDEIDDDDDDSDSEVCLKSQSKIKKQNKIKKITNKIL